MTSAKSKTRSGSTPRRRRRRTKKKRQPAEFLFPHIYIDESVSQVRLSEGLRQRDLKVWTRRDVYPNEPLVDDVTWLERCGREGWVAITKDQAIRRRPNEIQMVLTAKVRMFVITTEGLSAEAQLQLVINTLPAMRRWVREQRAPFIVRISAGPKTELLAKTPRKVSR